MNNDRLFFNLTVSVECKSSEVRKIHRADAVERTQDLEYT